MSSTQRHSSPFGLFGLAVLAVSLTAYSLSALPVSADSSGVSSGEDAVKITKIRLVADKTVVKATLNDSAAAQDLIAMLPLTLSLKDYASTEVVGDLPSQLSLEGAPAGYKPFKGDITHYAPWGNLAIFYKDFSYSSGLVPLGRIEGDVSLLVKAAPYKAVIELDE